MTESEMRYVSGSFRSYALLDTSAGTKRNVEGNGESFERYVQPQLIIIDTRTGDVTSKHDSLS